MAESEQRDVEQDEREPAVLSAREAMSLITTESAGPEDPSDTLEPDDADTTSSGEDSTTSQT